MTVYFSYILQSLDSTDFFFLRYNITLSKSFRLPGRSKSFVKFSGKQREGERKKKKTKLLAKLIKVMKIRKLILMLMDENEEEDDDE